MLPPEPESIRPTTISFEQLRLVAGYINNLNLQKKQSEEARASSKRAAKELEAFMLKHRIFDPFMKAQSARDDIKRWCAKISKTYYKEKHDYATSWNLLDKSEIENILKKMLALIDVLENVSGHTMAYISLESLRLGEKSFVGATPRILRRDARILESILNSSRRRGSQKQIPHVKNAAKEGAALLPKCMGRQFSKNLEAVGIPKQFVHLDALFLDTLLRSIDPEITFTKVNTALRSLSVKPDN